MSFWAGFEKQAVGIPKAVRALTDRIGRTTTDPLQRLLMHKYSPFKPGIDKKISDEIVGKGKTIADFVHAEGGTGKDSARALRTFKRGIVGNWQKVHPKGMRMSPAEKMERAGKIERQHRFEAGEEGRELHKKLDELWGKKK